MPTYEYQAVDSKRACEHCRARFEVRQSMNDASLKKCPECGGAVERVVSLCSVSTSPSEKAMLSDRNLKEKGFSKFVKDGEGRYRKTI